MKEPKKRKISMGDVARNAGVTKAAVSLALSNKPGVSQATRERILAIAQELGYHENPALKEAMTSVRTAGNLNQFHQLAYLQLNPQDKSFFHAPFQVAKFVAESFGCNMRHYRLQDSPETIHQQLKADKVTGILLAGFMRNPSRLNINWDSFVTVKLTGALHDLETYCVHQPLHYGLDVLLETLHAKKFQRIGMLVHPWQNPERLEEVFHASTQKQRLIRANSVETLKMYHIENQSPRSTNDFLTWVYEEQLQALCGFDHRIITFLEQAGWRVPKDLTFAHFHANLHLDKQISGLDARHSQRAALATKLVIETLRKQEFGFPEDPYEILVRPHWLSANSDATPRVEPLPPPQRIP